MRHLRWSTGAADDLEHIAAYLFDEAPSRVGKKAGTRELVLPDLPFIVVYRVRENAIDVVRILHGAQQWP